MPSAQITKIESIEVHPNADVLEIAAPACGQWRVIVKKGEFKPGDFCVYVEIDSTVPERPEFEFLRNKGFRIKSVRLRGELSQGIIFPVSILPQGTEISEGLDVSEILGVEHYEKPIPACLGGQVKGNFPTHLIPKTDEERIQNLKFALDVMEGKEVYVSVKSDGSSASYIKDLDGNFRVCSRNLELQKAEGNTFWEMAAKYDLENRLPLGYAVQAELAGEGVQKNPEGIKGQEIKVFNVWDLKSNRLLDYSEMIEFCATLEIPTVDIYYVGISKWNSVQEMLDEADKARYRNGKQAEGLVFRLTKHEYCQKLRKMFSVKAISNNYLLKNNE